MQSTKAEQYDVVVLGAGTAGSNAARAARAAGAKRVLVVRTEDLLNTCVEEGCMPSKSIIYSSAHGRSFSDAMARMDTHVRRLKKGLEESLTTQGFGVAVGRASFLPDGEGLLIVHGNDRRVVHGAKYVIATGSSSFIPPVDGLSKLPEALVLTSRGMVSKDHLSELPQSVFVLGAGPIGLEMTTVLVNFDVQVTLVEMEGLLPRMDDAFGVLMEKTLKAREGITLLTHAKLTQVVEQDGRVVSTVVTEQGESTYTTDKILVATGRAPALAELSVENVGLSLERGRVTFDPQTLQTENPDIYVAGDATGTYQILHYAGAMGRVAGHNAACGGNKKRMAYDALSMSVIFSEPQVAMVGLTEKDATEKGMETISAELDLPNVGRGLLEDQPVGLWKLTAEKGTGRIVGAQALGPSPHSEWFVDTASWLMHFSGTAYDVRDKEPYYHPTYPELFQSLGRTLCEKLTAS